MSVSVSANDAPYTASPTLTRGALLVLIAAAIAASLSVTGDATAQAGADLTRLLRAMAALKALMATGLIAAVLWRLGSAITPLRFVGYAIACGAAAAGPALIWGMIFVVSGAALLHGGLLAGILMLWRDEAVGRRLALLVTARR